MVDLDNHHLPRSGAPFSVTARAHSPPTREISRLGVEDPFIPAQKAHPGLLIHNSTALNHLGNRIEEAGFYVDWSERTTFAGYERFHCRDPFGNRLEVMTPAG